MCTLCCLSGVSSPRVPSGPRRWCGDTILGQLSQAFKTNTSHEPVMFVFLNRFGEGNCIGHESYKCVCYTSNVIYIMRTPKQTCHFPKIQTRFPAVRLGGEGESLSQKFEIDPTPPPETPKC